jgi:hypothetical protein
VSDPLPRALRGAALPLYEGESKRKTKNKTKTMYKNKTKTKTTNNSPPETGGEPAAAKREPDRARHQ